MTALYLLVIVLSLLCIGNVIGTGPEMRILHQRLDHFSTNSAVFNQRYWLSADYFVSTNAPPTILLLLNSFADPAMLAPGAPIDNWAKSLGAITVQLEMRFTGESLPFADFSTDNLKTQTIEQHLADIVSLQQEVDGTYLTSTSSQHNWIVIGSGFDGALATWFRSKFAFRSAGALAITPFLAPVVSFYDYDIYYYNKAGGQCATYLASTVQQLTSLLQSNATALSQVKSMWQCTSPLQDSTQILFVAGQIINYALDTNQKQFCKNFTATAAQSSSLTPMLSLLGTVLTQSGVSCNDWDLALDTNTTAGNSQSDFRPQLYLQCNQIGQFDVSVGTTSNGLLSTAINLAWYNTSVCGALFGFGVNTDGIAYTDFYYGSKGYNTLSATNVLHVTSANDPDKALMLWTSGRTAKAYPGQTFLLIPNGPAYNLLSNSSVYASSQNTVLTYLKGFVKNPQPFGSSSSHTALTVFFVFTLLGLMAALAALGYIYYSKKEQNQYAQIQ